MFGMGFTEILIIAVIAILFLGPDKLPSAMVDIAKFFRQMKKTVGSMKDTLEEEMNVSEIKQEALAYKKELLEAQDKIESATQIPDVGSKLTDFGDDIVGELNMIEKKYSSLVDLIWPAKRELRKAIDSQSKDIDKLKKEMLIERLSDDDGISLTPEKDDNYLPDFQVKWDWEISNVAGLRVVKKSTSGKSVDLEIKRRFRDWKTNHFKFNSEIVERVRLDKVESFLKRNQKYIG